VEDGSNKGVILSAKLVHEQILHVAHNPLDGSLRTALVTQALGKVLEQRPILLLNEPVLIKVVQTLHKTRHVILVDRGIQLALQSGNGGVGSRELPNMGWAGMGWGWG